MAIQRAIFATKGQMFRFLKKVKAESQERTMKISKENQSKIKNFLKVNLDTLQGQQLTEFMEKYDIREAGSVEMMLLDHGMPGEFIAFKNPSKPDTYFVTAYEMVEKILFLETLTPEGRENLNNNSPVRIN